MSAAAGDGNESAGGGGGECECGSERCGCDDCALSVEGGGCAVSAVGARRWSNRSARFGAESDRTTSRGRERSRAVSAVQHHDRVAFLSFTALSLCAAPAAAVLWCCGSESGAR